MNILKRFLFWPIFFTCQLIALMLISWHLLAQFHFAYPLGYKLLGLEQHIAEFAPLNHYKKDFEFTTPSEHWRIFGEISEAIQTNGRGLNAISYSAANGTRTALMHDAEIIHLQDVANLIDVFYSTGLSCLVVWLGLIALASWQRFTLPAVKTILFGFLAGFALFAIVIIALGPTAVFYWFHEQIFPDGHQWFFYYQDSLMTTLMKAPDIFAFIAILLLVLLITLWCASLWGFNYLLTPKTLKSDSMSAAPKKTKRK
jgi:hypothetical protein